MPVDPFEPRSARRTGSRAACSTLCVPAKLLRSVAVDPGARRVDLIFIDSNSLASASVIAMRGSFRRRGVATPIYACLALSLPPTYHRGRQQPLRCVLLQAPAIHATVMQGGVERPFALSEARVAPDPIMLYSSRRCVSPTAQYQSPSFARFRRTLAYDVR